MPRYIRKVTIEHYVNAPDEFMAVYKSNLRLKKLIEKIEEDEILKVSKDKTKKV